MMRIGIRELRQNASKWLHEVERGATLEVTDRGRPVALLTPLPQASLRDRMIASGRLRPAKGDLLDLPAPLPPDPGRPLASEALEQLRADER